MNYPRVCLSKSWLTYLTVSRSLLKLASQGSGRCWDFPDRDPVLASRLWRKPRKKPEDLGNALAALASLIALWFALQAIDLPASLLPNTNIFDIAHYQEEFTLIFDSLRELGLSDHPLFTTAAQAKVQCRQIICLFVLVGADMVTGDILGNRMQKKRNR